MSGAQENEMEQSTAKAERGSVQVKGGITDGSENLQR